MSAPFALTYFYVEPYGVDVEGTVSSKVEEVSTTYSSWSRTPSVTVQFRPTDSPGQRFVYATLADSDYDALHVGQRVTVRYLQMRDLPKVPLAHALGKMRFLPAARMVRPIGVSRWERFRRGPGWRVLQWIVAFGILLVVWRIARWPGFTWAIVGCVAFAMGAILISEFPKVTPAPSGDVRRAEAKVKYISRIDRLFEGHRSRGVDANQPIDVVAVEFVPAGRTDPVVAVDVIDSDSLPLREGEQTAIDYDARSPRVAHLRNASRTFPERNFNGIVMDAVVLVALLAGMFAFFNWAGKVWERFTARIKVR